MQRLHEDAVMRQLNQIRNQYKLLKGDTSRTSPKRSIDLKKAGNKINISSHQFIKKKPTNNKDENTRTKL